MAAFLFFMMIAVPLIAGPVENLQPGCWYAAPGSHLRDAEKKPQEWDDWNGSASAKYNSYQNNLGFDAIISTWSGGTFDSRRDRLVIFGGGHNGYGGNEVFVFDMDSLKWIRLTDPTPFPNRCTPEAAAGLPISRHTYGGLCTIAHADRMFALAGSPDCSAGGCGIAGTWTFSFASKTWQRMAAEYNSGGCEDNCVYWPEDGKVYFHTSASGIRGWYRFNNDANAWDLSKAYSGNTASMSCAIDPVRKLVVAVGGGNVNVYSLVGADLTEQTLTTTGETFLVSKANPGIAYDTALKKIVGWSGTNDVYSLDLSSNVWTKHSPAPGNMVNAPAVTASGGVYGRFQYSPKYNVYVTVNSVDENVFIYRLTAGTTVADPVKKNGSGMTFAAWPNPLNRSATLRFGQSGRATVQVLNLRGEVIAQASPVSGTFIWDASNAPAGIYLGCLFTDNTRETIRMFHVR